MCKAGSLLPQKQIYFLSSISFTDSKIVCPTIASVFGLILSIVFS